MKPFTSFDRRSGCGRLLLWGGIIGVIVYLFIYEVQLLFNALRSTFFPQSLEEVPLEIPLEELPTGGLSQVTALVDRLQFPVVVLIGIIVLTVVFVILVERSVLPNRTGAEASAATTSFASALFGRKPLLMRVREATLSGDPLELPEDLAKKVRFGSMLLVDLTSAVVLERNAAHADTGISGTLAAHSKAPPLRVGQPGLVVVHPGERLRGIVSLRKHFRINLNVHTHTSDGIPLKAHVLAIFTLGQPAGVFRVAYCGAMEPGSLHVLQINLDTRRIVAINDDLDDNDKLEIHRYAQNFLQNPNLQISLEMSEHNPEQPPFHIDEPRIIAAVSSQARHIKSGQIDLWHDLPTQVATEMFRNLLPTLRYDYLYNLEDPNVFPLQSEVKPAFARRMRLLGVARYQFVHCLDGACPTVDQRVDYRMYSIAPVQELRNSKPLRDRGIKIIHAGFTELIPEDETVRQQLLDNWRARWQRTTDTVSADSDLEVQRILAQVTSDKQRDKIASLTGLLNNTTYSEEALTLYVLQALDEIAAEPEAHHLQPGETLHLLQNVRRWLTPDDDLPSRFSPGPDKG